MTRLETAGKLRLQGDAVSTVLADLIDFHRREEKPGWWRMFDRAKSADEELRDDPGCIEGVQAVGSPTPEKQSLVQAYRFDPSQECKLSAGEKSSVMFSHCLEARLNLLSLDLSKGSLQLKISRKSLDRNLGGMFPQKGTLIPNEYVKADTIQSALTEVAAGHLTKKLHPPVAALLNRVPPGYQMQNPGEPVADAAIRLTGTMSGGCLVIQGPPGTGKTYTRVTGHFRASGGRQESRCRVQQPQGRRESARCLW